jgi:hypothetical protein
VPRLRERKGAETLSELYRERACVVCRTPHRNPWVTCGKRACIQAHRRANVTQAKRNLRERWEEEGACKGCGGSLDPRRRKRGYKTCSTCAALAVERKGRQRDRQKRAARKEAATQRVLDARAQRIATNNARLDMGLPPSYASTPKIPKSIKDARKSRRYGKVPEPLVEG